MTHEELLMREIAQLQHQLHCAQIRIKDLLQERDDRRQYASNENKGRIQVGQDGQSVSN